MILLLLLSRHQTPKYKTPNVFSSLLSIGSVRSPKSLLQYTVIVAGGRFALPENQLFIVSDLAHWLIKTMILKYKRGDD